jgi:hypothetical protein
MAKNWPGITDKAAFCAWLSHQQTGKWPAEKSKFSIKLPVAKFDDQTSTITGWAALSSANGEPVIDFHNDLILVSELEKTAEQLMLEGGAGKAGEMHARRVGDVVESLVLSKEKAQALGLGDVGTEGWIVSIKLRDPGARERVKNGQRSELSVHGWCKKIRVGERDGEDIHALMDLTVDEISVVDQGASGNADALPKIVLAKRRDSDSSSASEDRIVTRVVSAVRKLFGKENIMTLEDILAKLPEEERAVVLAAFEQAAAPAAPAAPVVPAAPVAPAAPVVPMAAQNEPAEPTEDEMQKALAGLPEPIRKRLETAEKAAAEKDTETTELRKRLDDMEERQEVAKFMSKAAELPYLAGQSTAEIAKLLRAASKSMKPEEYKAIEKMLADANTAVEGSPLFKEQGGRGNDAEKTAKGQIEAIAAKMRESDPKLSRAQAVSKALHENPELYGTYKTEMDGAAA